MNHDHLFGLLGYDASCSGVFLQDRGHPPSSNRGSLLKALFRILERFIFNFHVNTIQLWRREDTNTIHQYKIHPEHINQRLRRVLNAIHSTLFALQLSLANLVAGYTVCATYTSVDPTETVFSPRLDRWIKTFYSIAVVLNVITTSLMAYRIWKTHKRTSAYVGHGKSHLLSVLQILVESAALQLIVETVLLALYCSNINAQYILLESVASIVGITFNAITIRIKIRVLASESRQTSAGNPTQTIGSVPMRRIQVSMIQNVEDHSDSDMYIKQAPTS